MTYFKEQSDHEPQETIFVLSHQQLISSRADAFFSFPGHCSSNTSATKNRLAFLSSSSNLKAKMGGSDINLASSPNVQEVVIQTILQVAR